MARRTLKELISGGKLPIGSEVYHRGRIRVERSVSARVNSGGIEFRGKVYASPSGAARAVAGTPSENGWVFWRIKGTDQLLSELRDPT